jgi:hypothetical protein
MMHEEKISKIIKHHFTDFFVENGYKKYKDTVFGRIVNNDFFQFVNFDKAHGEKSILVDFTTYLLFGKKTPSFQKVITLKPGGRIDYFMPDRPDLRWFEYDTAEKLVESISTIKNILSDHVFNWLDEHTTVESIFALEEDRQIRVSDETWRQVYHIYMYLRIGNVHNALETAESILNEPPRFAEIVDLCKEVIATIKSDGFDANSYLSSIIEENKVNLKIENWPVVFKPN